MASRCAWKPRYLGFVFGYKINRKKFSMPRQSKKNAQKEISVIQREKFIMENFCWYHIVFMRKKIILELLKSHFKINLSEPPSISRMNPFLSYYLRIAVFDAALSAVFYVSIDFRAEKKEKFFLFLLFRSDTI